MFSPYWYLGGRLHEKYRSLENPRGIGLAYEQDQKVALVGYMISVIQEIIISRYTEIEGIQKISADLDVLDGDLELGKTYCLYLEDGRHWDFLVQQGNPITKRYTAMNTGQKGLYNPS